MGAPFRIGYEDDHAIVASKRSGLLVHRTPEARDRTSLKDKLTDWLAARDATPRPVPSLHPIHRIDRAASGLVIFGKSASDAKWLQGALAEEDMVKEYLVLVRGSPPERFDSERPLTDERGISRAARTRFRRERQFDRCALVRARIETGRRHQIRRHLNHLAHHALGDTQFGKGRINRQFRAEHGLHRLFLHACRLEFWHAPLGRRIAIEDPLPPELQWVLDRLPRPD